MRGVGEGRREGLERGERGVREMVDMRVKSASIIRFFSPAFLMMQPPLQILQHFERSLFQPSASEAAVIRQSPCASEVDGASIVQVVKGI